MIESYGRTIIDAATVNIHAPSGSAKEQGRDASKETEKTEEANAGVQETPEEDDSV